MDKRKNSILIFSILFLLVFAGIHIHRETNTILDVPVISAEEAVKLIEERQEYQKEIKIKYEGTTLPEIDEQGIFLLPQNGNEEYVGRLSGEAPFELAVVLPKQAKADLMASGKPLQILAYNEDVYREFRIVFSNLPVLSIEHTGEDEDGLLGEMTLIDPTGNGRDGVTEIVFTDCSYHVRGASSRNLDKKSYKLNLLTKKKIPG